MKNADEMTPKELRDLAREKEKLAAKPFQEGYLKHDLYESDIYPDEDGLYTKDDIQEYFDSFEIVLPKGTRFVCRMVTDNSIEDVEVWYDADEKKYEFVGDWPLYHLENIKDLK